MRTFIVRPFGIKKDIDFDRVEEELIRPAMRELGLAGGPTTEILRQGNIRADMFQRLLTADLVIADLSIHNANVFYELGIRHALRDKRTFLLRSRSDEYPFDLQTDRYLDYDAQNPAASVGALTEALRHTIASEVLDSPVFQLLPDLQAQDRSKFLAVPRKFHDEVDRAASQRQLGDLELLADEVQGFEWESEGLRVIGRVQFKLKTHEGGLVTWKRVCRFDPGDVEANLKLGTIYHRLGDLIRSNQALQLALEQPQISVQDRAETRALQGRNFKAQWIDDWQRASLAEQRTQALRSPFLELAFNAYDCAFSGDLNHYYPGINALSLLTAQSELAAALPAIWAERFEDDVEADRAFKSRREQASRLSGAVDTSIKAAILRNKEEDRVWAPISAADFLLFTIKKPARVADAYRRALAPASDFDRNSVRQQLSIFERLELFPDNVAAAVAAVTAVGTAESVEPTRANQRILLFTGHRIDDPGRTQPRFPVNKEDVARQAIKDIILTDRDEADDGIAFGIAGGASGGDILFHEVCLEIGIPTRLYLALPEDHFCRESVQSAGPQWVERYNHLCARLSKRILGDSKELPNWLVEKPDYDIWQRNNLWMLHNALALGGRNVTLIALWNGEEGEGSGGTKDMVERARQRGAKTLILDTNTLFGY